MKSNHVIRLGIAASKGDPWGFFDEIYRDFSEHFETTLFEQRTYPLAHLHERTDRILFNWMLQRFMQANDVVFFEWASEFLVAASMLPKTCGIVTRLHRYEMYHWVQSVQWDAVDKIILVSEAKRQEFIGRFPKHAHKTVVIPGVISIEKFQPKPHDFHGNIGTMCELLPRKRVYELILAFSEIAHQHQKLHLHIAGGSNPMYEDYVIAMQQLVQDLNLQKSVTFYGNVTNPQAWLHQLDIFVSNSYSEGLQVALMEAMASGCFCLSHRWAGADELLPGDYLFYTDRELQDKILSYCALSDMQKQAHQTRLRELACQKFDINRWKAPIRQLIYDVSQR